MKKKSMTYGSCTLDYGLLTGNKQVIAKWSILHCGIKYLCKVSSKFLKCFLSYKVETALFPNQGN